MSKDPAKTQVLQALHSEGRLSLSGDFTVWTLPALPPEAINCTAIDLAGVERFDTAAAWYLLGRQRQGVTLSGLSEPQRKLMEVVGNGLPKPDPEPAPVPAWRRMLENLGHWVAGMGALLRELAEYLGRFFAAIARAIRHPREFRLTSLVFHCWETGVKAVPIVALMSFLIGVVLAFQGASQLRQFGAEIFVVDLISISVLRELGILLTAIVVAGRTASALTASIGSMKMQEEIDAMRTLGLDPDMVLLLPRILALVIMLPILGLIANVSGLLGGAAMSWLELGISPSMFLVRLQETHVNHAIVGLSKAPAFAIIIGVIGCQSGMKVGKDAASLGTMTSTAVVTAIFSVIIADALFSIFFAQVGI